MELVEEVWNFLMELNIKKSSEINTMSFLTIDIFRKYVMKCHLLISKRQSQILMPLSLLKCCFCCDRSFINKYCDKSFVNKPAFLNFLPQLTRKVYCADTTIFNRFACMIVVHTHFFNVKTG